MLLSYNNNNNNKYFMSKNKKEKNIHTTYSMDKKNIIQTKIKCIITYNT